MAQWFTWDRVSQYMTKKKVKFNLIYKYIYIRDGSSLILSYITETFIDPIFFFTNMDLYKVKYLFYRADL